MPVPNPAAIKSTSLVCMPCAAKIFADLCYFYRRDIPAAELPGTCDRIAGARRRSDLVPPFTDGRRGNTAEVTKRASCHHGRGCWTQSNPTNPGHRVRYNHVV